MCRTTRFTFYQTFVYVQLKVKHQFESVNMYMCGVLCQTLNTGAKQKIKTANGKKHNTPSEQQSERANQLDKEQNIVQIGQVLRRVMSKHDPVHTSQNHKSVAQTQQNG